MGVSRSVTFLIGAVLCACVVAGTASATKSASAPPSARNNCPIVSASGNVGGAGSTGQSNVPTTGLAGGVALGPSNALGALVLDCENYSDALTITAPGHTFSTTAAIKCQGVCAKCKASSATTLTCTLSRSLEQVGIRAVGSWQATINWLYAPKDEAATNTKDGSCHILIDAALTVGGKPNFSGKDRSVCAYAAGDVLQ
jgi:hypothetical protein